jgi:hypothetical protein
VRLVEVAAAEQAGVGPLEEGGADAGSEHVADLVPGDGGHEAADEDDGKVEHALTRQQAGGEQQGVAGEEEPHEEAGLGEDDGEQADRAESLDQRLGVHRRNRSV